VKTKKIYVTIAVEVKEDFNMQKAYTEMTYALDHDDIVGTEIVDVETQLSRYGWED